MASRPIHLLWRGPHTYPAVRDLTGPSDYGVYRIHGPHPVLGPETLLYIGQASDQPFGSRFRSRSWMKDDWADNAGALRIYTGRIHNMEGKRDPSDRAWTDLINKAEKLLIATHSPPWNAQDVGGLKRSDSEAYQAVHVFNWGQYAPLLPEVSGARHTWLMFDQICDDPLSE